MEIQTTGFGFAQFYSAFDFVYIIEVLSEDLSFIRNRPTLAV